jgi:uncharacterized protein YifE (UPF0438 family)
MTWMTRAIFLISMHIPMTLTLYPLKAYRKNRPGSILPGKPEVEIALDHLTDFIIVYSKQGLFIMQNTISFKSDRKFLAQDIYPHGISRSGDFTIKQAKLLEDHGEAYQALQAGHREPVNKEERDFIAVCNGKKAPQTEHEIVWLRFCQKSIKRPVRAFEGSYYRSRESAHNADEDWAVELE